MEDGSPEEKLRGLSEFLISSGCYNRNTTGLVRWLK
jgi:hypothetical protein